MEAMVIVLILAAMLAAILDLVTRSIMQHFYWYQWIP